MAAAILEFGEQVRQWLAFGDDEHIAHDVPDGQAGGSDAGLIVMVPAIEIVTVNVWVPVLPTLSVASTVKV